MDARALVLFEANQRKRCLALIAKGVFVATPLAKYLAEHGDKISRSTVQGWIRPPEGKSNSWVSEKDRLVLVARWLDENERTSEK